MDFPFSGRNTAFPRGVSGIRELYQSLGWGRYASDSAVAEALQSLLASLVQFESAEAAKKYTYRLVDMIPESSLTEFVSDGRVQSKIELVIAGLDPSIRRVITSPFCRSSSSTSTRPRLNMMWSAWGAQTMLRPSRLAWRGGRSLGRAA